MISLLKLPRIGASPVLKQPKRWRLYMSVDLKTSTCKNRGLNHPKIEKLQLWLVTKPLESCFKPLLAWSRLHGTRLLRGGLALVATGQQVTGKTPTEPFWKPSVTPYVVSFWVRQSLCHAYALRFFAYAKQIEETLTRNAKRVMTRPLLKMSREVFRAAQLTLAALLHPRLGGSSQQLEHPPPAASKAKALKPTIPRPSGAKATLTMERRLKLSNWCRFYYHYHCVYIYMIIYYICTQIFKL